MPGINDFCFVIGAGAHAQYGFPLGSQLRQLIISFHENRARDPMGVVNSTDRYFNFQNLINHYNETLNNHIKENKLDPGIIKLDSVQGFTQSFAKSSYSSIDAFLANAPNVNFKRLGKIILSYLMISYESNINFENIQLGWIQYLLNEFAGDREAFINFIKDGPKFLTFNYDTFLERVILERALSYGIEKDEAQKLSEFSIYHIYGKTEFTKFLYNSESTAKEDSLNASIKSLKVIGEDRESRSLKFPIDFLSKKKVAFIGFGYDKQNMDLLKSSKVIQSGKNIFGSVLNLLEPEVSVIRNNYFSEAVLIEKNCDTDTLIRNLMMHFN